jgi:2-haloacid dehalogenase
MLDFSNFEVLTFDCYGTLIDWETGILAALKPVLTAHGKSIPDAKLLEFYGDLEAEAEAGAYRPYGEILRSVVRNLGKQLSFTPTVDEGNVLLLSLVRWRPWPDSVDALAKLGTRYRLAIISNIDDLLFESTRPQLHVDLESVTTAQQARCYKPGLEIFRKALEGLSVAPARVLHVGQSVYHDVLPAQSLGLGTVRVNRPSVRAGIGAVRSVSGQPDLEVPDLATLAALATA